MRAQYFIYSDEDGWEFVELQMALLNEWRPEGALEEYLVQRIAIAMWQVWRSLRLETGVVETARQVVTHQLRKLNAPNVVKVRRDGSEAAGSEVAGSDAADKEQSPDVASTTAALLEVSAAKEMPTFPLLLRYRAAAEGALYKAVKQLRGLQAERKSRAGTLEGESN